MATYIWDKVLEPAVEPIANISVKELGDMSEKAYVEDLFRQAVPKAHGQPGLSKDWKVVYRQEKSPEFLCTNWAFHRLKGDLKAGQPFPHEALIDAPSYTVDKFAELLNGYGLIDCPFDDPKRIAITWGSRNKVPSPDTKPETVHGNEPVAHIQVKYNGHWESKMSLAPFAITHGEDDFGSYYYFGEGAFIKARCYKKKE